MTTDTIAPALYPEQIARVCHEANRALQRLTGEAVSPEWDAAPDWQRVSAVNGVQAMLRGEATSPEEQHQRWCHDKIAAGWSFGYEKNAEAKTHPCLVPYSALPPLQRAKDHVFRAIVGALTGA